MECVCWFVCFLFYFLVIVIIYYYYHYHYHYHYHYYYYYYYYYYYPVYFPEYDKFPLEFPLLKAITSKEISQGN